MPIRAIVLDRLPLLPDRRRSESATTRECAEAASIAGSSVVAAIFRLSTALVSTAVVMIPAAVHAEDVVVRGADGRQGAVGLEDQDGEPGGDGETVVLEVESSDPTNRAAVSGGDGGNGGGTLAVDGTSGSGGSGGDATAIATTQVDAWIARAIAHATGGRGGFGGPVFSGQGVVGPSGTAGSAHATAVAINVNGAAQAEAWSFGGSNLGAGDGANATASITARGTRAATGLVSVFGGNGGGSGGNLDIVAPPAGHGASVFLDDTVATLSASDADAAYRLTVIGTGGQGGRAGTGRSGDGGDAEVVLSRAGESGSEYRMSLQGTGGDAGDATSVGVVSDAFGRAGNAYVSGALSFGGDATLEVSSQGGDGGSLVGSVPGALVPLGSDGGSATGEAHVESLTPGGHATAIVNVIGGSASQGSALAGAGGNASGSATATATSTGVATARLTARGGIGGSGATRGADGTSISLVDSVSGIGGSVVLQQNATGGDGGSVPSSADASVARGGDGGDASSTLVRANPDGDLNLGATAVGGRAGRGAAGGAGSASVVGEALGNLILAVSASGGEGATGGVGWASAVGEAGGDVTISALARSGTSIERRDPDAGPGVEALVGQLGDVRGTSTGGGTVDVTGSIYGANGVGPFGPVGAGADAVLVDAISGQTSGVLTLRQNAIAGDAGTTANDADITPGWGARGGDARSELHLDANVGQLNVELVAGAGDSRGRDSAGSVIAGGSATTQSVSSNDAGGIEATYKSLGGNGATSDVADLRQGDGGAAISIVRATTTGDGHAVRIAPFGLPGGDRGSIGGSGGGPGARARNQYGGDGGAASTTVEGIALGDSEVDVFALATGGASGDGDVFSGISGTGGAATATAVGRNAGASAVSVLAEARGGDGFSASTNSRGTSGGDGGDARASAHGESSGGGDVTVRARVRGGSSVIGRGADATLHNAVSGRTSGILHLVQEAFGGHQRSSLRDFVRAGAARSELEVDDADASELVVESIAQGGNGRTTGAAYASASGIGVRDVSVLARATGGGGDDFLSVGDGAIAELGRVFGESTQGGSVRVVGEAIGGRGAAGRTLGRGGDAVIESSVDGATSGRLELVQRAIGGDAGNDRFAFVNEGASGGSATNRLTRSVRAGELALVLSARGGAGGTGRQFLTSDPTRGGDAVVEADVANETGRADLQIESVGGKGGGGSIDHHGDDGGDASLRVTARTLGDGADITIGGGGSAGPWGAMGGDAYSASTGLGSERGNGGSASSRSIGIALGDSLVRVEDRAYGGDGFQGGSANSAAIAENDGHSAVSAIARASSGRSSDSGPMGDATAQASSRSSAGVGTARADASIQPANLVIGSGEASRAHALADAAGSIASAESNANGRTGTIGTVGAFVTATARATGGRSLSAESIVGGVPELALSSTRNATSVSTGDHTHSGEWGRFGLHLASDESSPDIVLHAEVEVWVPPATSLDGVFARFYGSRSDADDFDELTFRIIEGEDVRLERSFVDSVAARLFFASPIDLGALVPSAPSSGWMGLVFSLEGRGSSAGSGFGMVFSVGTNVIPEPGTALLFGTGLALLSVVGRSSRRTARIPDGAKTRSSRFGSGRGQPN